MKAPLSLLVLLLFASSVNGQDAATDSTGLPGDNFSLQGALDLFKHAKDLESFEQALNEEGGQVNNLDLDGDGHVDYIRVVDHQDGDAHAIVMQVAVSQDESQDVAVIELEKPGDREAEVQIRGAEDLYGPDVIVEPYAEDDAVKQPAKGPAPPDLVRLRVWVNVWAWPCVAWIYSPSFVVWTSPWHWGYYPHWWRPWRPNPYRVFWGWQRPRMVVYRPVHVCRVVRANAVYMPHARYAPRVRAATAPVIQRRAALRPERGNRAAQRQGAIRPKGQRHPGDGRRAAPARRAPREKAGRRAHR